MALQSGTMEKENMLQQAASHIRKMQEQIQSMAWERKNIDGTLTEARDEIKARARETAALTSEITVLQQEIQSLKTESAHAIEAYEQVVSRYRQLKSEYAQSEGQRVCVRTYVVCHAVDEDAA